MLLILKFKGKNKKKKQLKTSKNRTVRLNKEDDMYLTMLEYIMKEKLSELLRKQEKVLQKNK